VTTKPTSRASARVSTKATRRSSKKTARRRAQPASPARAAKPAVKAVAKAAATTVKAASPALRALREAYGMSREKFGRLSGFSVRSQANWENGSKAPSDQAALRLAELARLHRALATVMRPDSIAVWLDTPNLAFDGLKPVEVVERGQIDRLWKMIFLLESGTAA